MSICPRCRGVARIFNKTCNHRTAMNLGWVSGCFWRAACLVKIYWLLQACHRDHCET